MNKNLGVNIHQRIGCLYDGLITNLGVGWVRIDMNWQDIQPQPNKFTFDAFDELLGVCLDMGLQVYPTIGYCPEWAGHDSRRDVLPVNQEDWINFVSVVSGRYRSYVKYWGIWNEPNKPGGFSVQDYTNKLFIPAAKVLHEHGLFACGPDLTMSSGWNKFLLKFLQSTIGYLDVITVHTYESTGKAAMESLCGTWNWPWKPKSVVQVMKEAGVDIRYACTETGMDSKSESEYTQACYVLDLLNRYDPNNKNHPIAVMMYDIIDEPDSFYGMFREDRSQKPVVDVIRKFS